MFSQKSDCTVCTKLRFKKKNIELNLLRKQNQYTMPDLKTDFAGLKLKNPIIIGSSGLTDNKESVQELEENGAAAVVLKSLFEEEIVREMQSSLSSMSSESSLYPETLEYYENTPPVYESTQKYLDLITDVKKTVSIPVIASINCMTSEQWTYFPKRIVDAGADAIELNIFLLPSDLNRTASETEKIYLSIIEEVKKQINIPIVVKLSFYFSNLATFLKEISSTGISGMVLFNRFYNPDIDIDNMVDISSAILSNPSDLYQSLRWIAIMSDRVDCDLAASTGIHDSKAVIKQLLAGAKAVQVVSSIYKNGSSYIQTMLRELEEWMNTKNFQNISDFTGKFSQSKSSNPAAYSRVQFMKYFRQYKPQT